MAGVRNGSIALLLCTAPLLPAASAADPAANTWPTEGWPVSTPEVAGLIAEPLEHLAADARSGRFRDLHSLLVVRDGRIVFEEYLPGGAEEQLHTVQSVSKSVTATLVGLAIHRGDIASTDTPLLDYFPQYEHIENLDDRKRSITLEHVLRMRLGMEWREPGIPYDAPDNSLRRLNEYDGDWYQLVLDTPMGEAPGERRLYNSGGTILLAGVLEHATGLRADEYARAHLFEPLGIRSFDWTVVRGVPHTGGGLSLRSRDMAKIGYLHLTDGVWDGERLLPEGWVERATTGPITSTQPGVWPSGYGYLWWLLPGPADLEREAASAEIYCAWGYMGQFIFVAPAYDLVFVTTGGATDFNDEAAPFDILYDYVVPAVDPSFPFEPPSDDVAAAEPAKEDEPDDEPSIPTFETTFGGVNRDRGIDVTPTADGGYAIVGTTTSFGAGDEDVYLIRTDDAGEPLFTKAIGGPAQDCGWSVHETADGGFVIAGFTASFGAGGLDGYLVRTDAAGDTLWTRTYGGAGDDLLWSLLPLDDGGFALAGQTESAGAGEIDAYLVRTDADGRPKWERTYGGALVDRVFSIVEADGGFVLAGITYSFGAGGRDGYVVKTDADGREVWSRPFGSEGYDVIHAACATTEPGCLVVGYTGGLGVHGGHDGWVLKLDPDGEPEWTSIFGGNRDDRILNGEETPDGGYVVGGFTMSTESTGLDAYLAKLDASGTVEWTQTIGGRGEDSGYGIACTPDGGVILTGLTKSTGAGEADVYVIKRDGRGR